MLSFWSYVLLAPSTPAPAGEVETLPDIKDQSDQLLFEKIVRNH